MDYIEMLADEDASRKTIALFESLQRERNELSKECEEQREAYRRNSLARKALIASLESGNDSFMRHPKLFAEKIYKLADAMIEIKEKENYG